ncbi:MAG: DNA mismatch repair endonuclease MutL [Eubacterium sp.]|nr:DNA mismatch repair endonuclease MutL [Eubacterium sp.]
MSEINILPKEVYQLIAAGEVVERPSSVVKEMLENSVDAGAKNITVEIKNGGSTYIRITDDGSGIPKSEVKKVFMPHATSKIKTGSDLDSIATLGFRGEAMSSIAAVARVELLTRAKGEELGTRYEIAGGEELDFSDAGCPEGTTVVVRDIFFNTPARMKFLKKDVTEGNSVAGIVDRMAISHPEVSFRFIREGKQTLITSGNGELKSAVYSVFGKEFSDGLAEVDYSVNGMRVTGLVTRPAAARKSRAMQFFFINSRSVRCATATAALEQAYKNSVMVGKFPGCVLNIECDTSFVDVNVHPAKIEVRFANERPVFELVYYGVKSAIETQDKPKEAHFPDYKAPALTASGKIDIRPRNEEKPVQLQFKQKTPDDFWQVAAPSSKPERNEVLAGEAFKISLDDLTEKKEYAPAEAPVKEESPNTDVPDFRIVGEAFKTYIIAEIEGALYFIDKHAAHERMNFEKLKRSTQINSQLLLQPVAVRLSPEEYNAVCDNLGLYSKCGFAVEDFGGNTVIVRECPSMLGGEDIADLIVETAGKLLDGKTDITPERMDWIFHSTSCRAAVKAGDYTSPQERELFVKRLLSMPDIRYCPHGRPVMIKMSKYDIEKQFGRA